MRRAWILVVDTSLPGSKRVSMLLARLSLAVAILAAIYAAAAAMATAMVATFTPREVAWRLEGNRPCGAVNEHGERRG